MENTNSSGFVLVSDIIPDIILDIRYYSTYNFLGERVDEHNLKKSVQKLSTSVNEALLKILEPKKDL